MKEQLSFYIMLNFITIRDYMYIYIYNYIYVAIRYIIFPNGNYTHKAVIYNYYYCVYMHNYKLILCYNYNTINNVNMLLGCIIYIIILYKTQS